jgi:hypothetical protein
MAVKRVAATFSVTLGSDTTSSSGSVKFEVDSREDGLNANKLGKTSGFSVDDGLTGIYFLLYLPPGIVYDTVKYPDDCFVKHTYDFDPKVTLTKTSQSEVIQTLDILSFHGIDNRTADLSGTALDGIFRVANRGWYGNNLAAYFGGSLSIGSNNKTISLPPVPTGFVTDPTQRPKKLGVVGRAPICYDQEAIAFILKTDTATAMKSKHGAEPYEISGYVSCVDENSAGTSICAQ